MITNKAAPAFYRPDALPVAQPTALSNLGIYFSLFQVNTKHLMMISN